MWPLSSWRLHFRPEEISAASKEWLAEKNSHRRIVRGRRMFLDAWGTLVFRRIHGLVTPTIKMGRMRTGALHCGFGNVILDKGWGRHSAFYTRQSLCQPGIKGFDRTKPERPKKLSQWWERQRSRILGMQQKFCRQVAHSRDFGITYWHLVCLDNCELQLLMIECESDIFAVFTNLV